MSEVVASRWGDIVDGVHPPEHPYMVAHEAVMMAGNEGSCLDDGDWHAVVCHAVELDHLPREQRVREVAVYTVATAIRGGWSDFVCGRSDDGWTPPAEQVAEFALLWADGEAMAKEWRRIEREDRRERRKRRKNDDGE